MKAGFQVHASTELSVRSTDVNFFHPLRGARAASYSTLVRATLGMVLFSLACTAAAFIEHSVATLVVAILAQVGVMLLVTNTRHAVDRLTARLRELSEKDPATGCLNRRGFGHVLNEAVAAGRTVALLALDLDHFKRINDRYGHTVGDAVLSGVSATLVSTVGSGDFVARLGGEEFGVLLIDADAEDAGVMAELLACRLKCLRMPVLASDDHVTTSIGIAVERLANEQDCAALRVRADEALYMAKRQGRDRIRLWAPGVRTLATPAASSMAITRDQVRKTPSSIEGGEVEHTRELPA